MIPHHQSSPRDSHMSLLQCGFLRAVLVLVIVTGSTVFELQAQRNCRKGIPCGNTCISASKVCRIGSGSSREPEPMAPPAARPTAEPAALAPQAAPAAQPAPAPDTQYPWIGSFADGIYFRAGCPAALDLAPTNRRYFSTEVAAQDAGYRKSRVPDC